MMKKIFNLKLILQSAIKSRWWRNLSALTLSEIFIRLAKFIILAIAARELGPELFGVFNYLLAIAALIAVIGDFGINKIITRNIAVDRSLISIYSRSLGVQVIIIAIFIGLFSLGLYVFQPQLSLVLFIMLALFTGLNILGDYIWSFFRALELMKLEAIAKGVQAGVVLIAGGLLLISPFPLVGLGVAYFIGAFSTALIGLYQLRTLERDINLHPDLSVWRGLVGQSWPIAIVAVSAFIFNQIDSIMLGLWNLLTDVGYYNAAYKIIGGLIIPMFLLNQVLYPKFSKLDMTDGIALVRKNILANLVMYSLALIFVGAFGKEILELFFGAEYGIAKDAFFVLTAVLLLTALSFPVSNWLIAKDYLKVNLFISVFAAMLNITTNYILIPQFGYLGAAIATYVTYVFITLAYYVVVFIIRRKTLSGLY